MTPPPRPRRGPHEHGIPLCNDEATSAPRRGRIGVLPVDVLPDIPQADGHEAELVLAVSCPECTSYARIVGTGREFRNVSKLLEPRFSCTACSWGPSPGDCPEQWDAYYSGRLGGTLVWAANEEHMEVLVRWLETPPNRRGDVSFPWEYRALMSRIPRAVASGRRRHDMVSLVKRLQRTRPHGI